MISAEIVADSVNVEGRRLTTMKICYPRFIHAEFMTHRAFSRNASSSRAIPVTRMLTSIDAELAEPVSWGRNQAGMQARVELDVTDRRAAQAVWRGAGRDAVRASQHLSEIGAHKQIANRVTEPWQHIDVVVTATDWDNFFALRCHADADPTMAELAWSMAHAYFRPQSQPRVCEHERFSHLPFVGEDEVRDLDERRALAASVARCARVSYRNHDGSAANLDRDLELADSLSASGHWSPFEHQAMPGPGTRSGNFRGWIQYRQTLTVGMGTGFDYDQEIEKLAIAGKRVPGLR